MNRHFRHQHPPFRGHQFDQFQPQRTHSGPVPSHLLPNEKLNSFDNLKNVQPKNSQEKEYTLDLKKDEQGHYNTNRIVSYIKEKTNMAERILVQAEDPNIFDSIVTKLQVMASDVTQKVKNSEVYKEIHELGEKVDEIRKQKLKEWGQKANDIINKFMGNLNTDGFSDQDKTQDEKKEYSILNKEELKKIEGKVDNNQTPPENHIILDKKESYSNLNSNLPQADREEFGLGCRIRQ